MVEFDLEKESRCMVTFRNIMMVFAVIFILGGAMHLSGAHDLPEHGHMAGTSQTIHTGVR